jgi:hypothetical protein
MSRLNLPALLVCLALAACGADGDPQAPNQPGITVSGEVGIGTSVVLK